MLEDALGPGHLFTHHARAVLGGAKRGLGRPEAALASLQSAVGELDRALGRDRALTWNARFHLALTLADLDRYGDAREMLADVVDHRTARLGANHRQTRAAAEALARLEHR